jgi:chemotaxis protein MotB
VSRLKRDNSDVGNDDWMQTYADMVTLLMAFFVLLFSFSSVDAQKFESMLQSVQSALGIKLEMKMGATPIPPSEDQKELVVDAKELIKREDMEQLKKVRDRLERNMASKLPGATMKMELEPRGLAIRFADTVLFDTGKAQLKDDAKPILKLFSEEMKGLPNHVRVEGHTDNRPINTPRFPSNWELSTARANQVLRYLLQLDGLKATRLSAAGYGEYRPVATNDTPEGRAKNRRVDLIILRLSYGEGEPK